MEWKSLIVCNVDCSFTDLLTLAYNIINNLVFVSTFIAVIVFIYAGFTLITSKGNVRARDKAKHAFTMVAVGYAVILLAWVLVYTVTNVLFKDEFNFIIG